MANSSSIMPLSPSNAEGDAQGSLSRPNETARPTQVGGGPREFPVASTTPRLPAMIPDEILDYYGWLFCQGGFLNLDMTFEGFLAVIAAVSPSGLRPKYEASVLDLSLE